MQGSIKKGVHRGNFSQIPNEVLQRKDMSMQAKGMLSCLLSLPETWVVYKKNLPEHFSNGRDACYKAFEELVKLNYIVKIVSRDKGKFGYDYEVYDLPTVPGNPSTVSSSTDFPVAVNQSLINTTEINTQEEIEKENYNKKISETVENIYQAYPTKCLVRGTASTGKTVKNKEKIKQLLKSKDEEELEGKSQWLQGTIDRYIQECISGNTWMKNFSTFLNNIPDYGDVIVVKDSEQVLNSFGTPIPSSLPKAKNKGELDKEHRGVVNVLGENWFYDMELCEWLTIEESKNKNK